MLYAGLWISGAIHVTFEESLKLERYKFVTGRQGYFTDLAKETFSSFARTFAAVVAGAVTLISLRKQLELDSTVVIALLDAIAVLLTLAAGISIAQIVFCLNRWYGFRRAECEINSSVPIPEPWAWLFEGMYCLAILAAILVAWWGINHFEVVLEAVAQKK
jgi:hypothetical protein